MFVISIVHAKNVADRLTVWVMGEPSIVVVKTVALVGGSGAEEGESSCARLLAELSSSACRTCSGHEES
jgi:hypothetical protein